MANTSKLSKYRKEAKLTQQQLADAIGSHWTTISRLENGKMELDYVWARRLAPILNVSIPDLLHDYKADEKIFIRGAIGEGGKTMRLFLNDSKNTYSLPSLYPGSWYVVDDDSFYPQFRHGDLIHLSTATDIEPYIGRVGFVTTIDEQGPQKEYFGTIARGKAPGKYCVRRPNAPDSEDFTPFLFSWVDAAHFYVLPMDDDEFNPTEFDPKNPPSVE